MTMDLSSTALAQGSDMPRRWPGRAGPGGTDHDLVHWVLVDIPPTVAAIPEGGRQLPDGSRDGLNDWPRGHGPAPANSRASDRCRVQGQRERITGPTACAS